MDNKFPHDVDCRCRESEEARLKWYVNAPEYHNCFWCYLQHNTRPHTLLEVSELLNLSISAITNTEKRALAKLRRRLFKGLYKK